MKCKHCGVNLSVHCFTIIIWHCPNLCTLELWACGCSAAWGWQVILEKGSMLVLSMSGMYRRWSSLTVQWCMALRHVSITHEGKSFKPKCEIFWWAVYWWQLEKCMCGVFRHIFEEHIGNCLWEECGHFCRELPATSSQPRMRWRVWQPVTPKWRGSRANLFTGIVKRLPNS